MVGQIAKRQAITNPENTIFSVKRLMGRKFRSREVQEAMKRLPYKVVEADNGDAHVELRGKHYSPPEISAMILQKMRQTAEVLHGEAGRALAGRVDVVVGIGPLAQEILAGAREAGLAASALVHFADAATASATVASLVTPGDAVLVKASRGLRLEQVIDALVLRFGEAEG